MLKTPRSVRLAVPLLLAALAATPFLLPSVTEANSAGSGPVSVKDGNLTWTVPGGTTVSLRSVTSGTCGDGVSAPCVVLGASSPSENVQGCVARQAASFEVGCPTSGVRRVALIGEGDGPVDATTKATPAGSCSEVELSITQTSGNGVTAVNDGCAQVVRCGAQYVGTVQADSQDSVEASCAYVQRNRETERAATAGKPCTLENGCAPGSGGGGSSQAAAAPTQRPTHAQIEAAQDAGRPGTAVPDIKSVVLKRLSPGRMTTSFRLSSAGRFTATLQRRSASGHWSTAASVSSSGRVGANLATLRRSGRVFRSGRYRVVVAAAGARNVARSKTVRVR